MKVYSWSIGEILAKIDIYEYVLLIFLINVINILQKQCNTKSQKPNTCRKPYVRKLYWSVYLV